MNYKIAKKSNFKNLAIGIILIFIASSIIAFPEISFNASLKGLNIWWGTVFPALLPFLIIAEILLGTGIIHFIGVLLEPIMRPLFNVPGVGSFVLAMGFASGYPMASKLTARFREQKLVTKAEGERLVAFTTTSDPIFLFGAIAVGFFHDAKLGVIIAVIHYTSSILVGFIMRFHHKSDTEKLDSHSEFNDNNIFIRAFKTMEKAKSKDERKFGKLMGDSVMSSIETLVMIGGFIIFFSVLLAVLQQIQITVLLAKLISIVMVLIGFSTELASSVIYGLFEVTLGAKSISETSLSVPMEQKLAILCAISAWSGISVHAQIAAIIQQTDMKYSPFLFAKIIHMIIAFILALIAYRMFNLGYLLTSVPTFLQNVPYYFSSLSVFDAILILLLISTGFLLLLLILSLLIRIYKRITSSY